VKSQKIKFIKTFKENNKPENKLFEVYELLLAELNIVKK